jgi:small subunit ribosomal protein S6
VTADGAATGPGLPLPALLAVVAPGRRHRRAGPHAPGDPRPLTPRPSSPVLAEGGGGRAGTLDLRAPCAVPVHRARDACSTLLLQTSCSRHRPEEVGFSVRRYELMVILDPDLEERTIAPSLDRFLTVVTNSGGTVKTEIWGRRRLAYEIKKHVEGIYAIVDIQAEPAAVAELDRQLNLNESVLRTKLMRPEVH